ncbi:helix-turn-helix transcriptional regulator [Arthrobacter echini]|uniref:Helix-turn-helix transcriptional regulator n=1 Tax=Arthrobacter echini TaxID=1529066 RepID=A0A4S5E873_9MICC|nr:helix-turn-helix transcriptional regulator [Arthrobacter echini]THJ67861.1 helix-turn-helix transcriptional regulator [Arthrobacter echini]
MRVDHTDPLTPSPAAGTDTVRSIDDPALREAVLALSVGFRPFGPVPPLVHSAGESFESLITRATADGLVTQAGRPHPDVRTSVLHEADAFQVRRLQRTLIEVHEDHGVPLGGLAQDLARDGLQDARLPPLLLQEAVAALADDPAEALELFDLAVAAGADPASLAAARAEAAASSGELNVACRILDEYFAGGEESAADEAHGSGLPDFSRAVRVSASVWAQRGMMSRAAAVHRWAAGVEQGSPDPLGVVALVAAGDRDGALELRTAQQLTRSPSLTEVSAMLLADGVLASLESPGRALPLLVRASDTLTASGRLLPSPETPAALAGLAAIMAGAPSTARSVIAPALEGRQGGDGERARLCLIAAWAAMLAEQFDDAHEFIARARASVSDLVPRDEVLLCALQVGMARRTDDTAGLVYAWQRAGEALLHVTVDLFTLLPLGELMIAGARLRKAELLEPFVDEAWSLLERIGEPALWTVPLRWCAVQAELLLERPARLAPHAAALVRAAADHPLAGTYAAAGRAWVRVLGGRIDPDAVETAARGLAEVGHAWDGARLAGHASARAGERRDMIRLLACARDLRPAPRRTAPAAAPEPVPASARSTGRSRPHRERALRADAPQTGDGRIPASTRDEGADAGVDTVGAFLSDREREIAAFVVQGRTYREISETVFISPRTVEHHMARIRRRLGADTRSDLLARLRPLIADTGARIPAAP